MKKTVAIVQSNYIPWKGYFDLINMADEFILYDSCQYTKRDWRNRNIIKTNSSLLWLTIPINQKGRFNTQIIEATVSDQRWRRKHWQTILCNYSKAKHFREHREVFESLYLGEEEKFLSLINHRFISAICGLLGISTKISWSTDFYYIQGKTDRLVHLCEQVGATEYLSGPAAKGYLDERLFQQSNIAVQYMDYSDYPVYHQFGLEFEHAVSIIDLIFHMGPDAKRYMKSFSLPI